MRLCLGAALLLTACSSLTLPDVPTPFPTEYLPTLIALTLQANSSPQASGAGLTERTEPVSASPQKPAPEAASPTASRAAPSATPPPVESPTLTPGPARSGTPTRAPSRTPSPSPTPELPFAEVQIRNLGPLSRVTSPLSAQLYLKLGTSSKVQIELLGEDGRLLYRAIRAITSSVPGAWIFLVQDVEFEIAATAESGRLVVSVDDQYGRITALSSVPLILLSIGQADPLLPADTLAPVVIQQPLRKSLVQGGKVVVSGLVRPESEQPLLVRLLNSRGAEVGSRLASIGEVQSDGYHTFSVEVPYSVTGATDVLLVITMGAAGINDVVHLASREIVLSP